MGQQEAEGAQTRAASDDGREEFSSSTHQFMLESFTRPKSLQCSWLMKEQVGQGEALFAALQYWLYVLSGFYQPTFFLIYFWLVE